MSNRKELERARRKRDYAVAALAAVERLPRRKGSLVLWDNGVVWRRIGDDQWEGLHHRDRYESTIEVHGLYPSEHVATSAGQWSEWVVLKRLPNPDEPEARP